MLRVFIYQTKKCTFFYVYAIAVTVDLINFVQETKHLKNLLLQQNIRGVTKKKPDCCYKNFNTAYFDTLKIAPFKVIPLRVNTLLHIILLSSSFVTEAFISFRGAK